MATLSVVISAYNEEKKIAACLSSVQWADERIVVNSGSTDKTASIARKHGARVYERENNPMLNINKNYGFTKATSDWILSLDADEQIPDVLAKEITAAITAKNDITGYWIPRKNIIFGKWVRYGLWWPDKQLRLFRRGKGKFACKHLHEYIDVEGRAEHLSEPYIHYNYESVSQYIRKMDTLYTEGEVEKLIASKYQLAWYDALRFPLSDFVKIYFAQKGYKDGLHGLVLGILQAMYSFIVFAKLWERQSFRDVPVSLDAVQGEMKKGWADIGYWVTSTRIEETRNPLSKLWLRLKRKYDRATS